MLKPWLLFAATGPLDTTPPLEPGGKIGGLALQEILLLVGVAAILAIVLFLAVYIFRRNSRQRYSQGGAQVLVPAEHRDHHHFRPAHETEAQTPIAPGQFAAQPDACRSRRAAPSAS